MKRDWKMLALPSALVLLLISFATGGGAATTFESQATSNPNPDVVRTAQTMRQPGGGSTEAKCESGDGKVSCNCAKDNCVSSDTDCKCFKAPASSSSGNDASNQLKAR